MNNGLNFLFFFSPKTLSHHWKGSRKENDEEKSRITNHESRIKNQKILASYASLNTHTHTYVWRKKKIIEEFFHFHWFLTFPILLFLTPSQELQIDSWFFFFQIIMMMIIWFVVVVVVVFVAHTHTHTEENRATNTIL